MAEVKSIQVSELRKDLARYLRDAQRGGEFVVLSRDRPLARLGPPAAAQRRPVDLLRGRIDMAADFDTLPADLLALIECDEPGA